MHSYTATGTYTVTLTATNCNGSASVTAVHTLTVVAAPPTYKIYLPIVFKSYGS